MWGIDTALDNTLDDDQAAYFRQAAARLLARGRQSDPLLARAALAAAPEAGEGVRRPAPARSSGLVIARGATMPLFLAGDSHFFAHYRRVDGVAEEDHITAGGGGAFLQPTHNLPEQVPYETWRARLQAHRSLAAPSR